MKNGDSAYLLRGEAVETPGTSHGQKALPGKGAAVRCSFPSGLDPAARASHTEGGGQGSWPMENPWLSTGPFVIV